MTTADEAMSLAEHAQKVGLERDDPLILELAETISGLLDEIDSSYECGESNPAIDNGSRCIRFAGHTEFKGQRNHITATGFWWSS